MLPIFLIGYMGSGKTTLGRGVESRTHIAFIDLDEYIEGKEGKTIKEIFKEEGEVGFRNKERDSLRELSEREDVVVACGGGTPCFYDNMEIMNSRGETIWLDASVEILHRRLKEGRAQRPLIANLSDEELKGYIKESLEKRKPYYRKAKHRFCADEMDTSAELEMTIGKFVAEYLRREHD